jgi:IclR family pca regulon transcriptional regulator
MVDHVQSLARGLAVIRAFSATAPALTLSEVARETGLTRATARRFLLTLVELGYAYLSSLSLPEVAAPHLERLAAEVHESASVAVLDGEDVVYVARVATARVMRVTISIGTRFPAYCTSMGRVLLAALPPADLDHYLSRATLRPFTSRTLTSPTALRAELDQVRGRGWAMVDQELEEGLRSLAVRIRNRSGTTVAAVNVSTHASRTTLQHVRRELLPLLQATAARIESDLSAQTRT